MIFSLCYLGPKYTWSHAAALRAKRLLPELARAELVPIVSSKTLFKQLLDNDSAAAIVPTYNLEQGIVYDFARFHLFEEVGSLELKTKMCLFGSAETVSDLKIIYTKDTVLPQVSDWLSSLPKHIKIVARPDISTATGVKMAVAEPLTGAICSEAAGHAHGLKPLALGIANKPENYTAFSVFKRQEDFSQPSILNSPPEYGFGIDSNLERKLMAGGQSVLWHIGSEYNQVLHLGHISAVLTLHKLASFGNYLVIQVEDLANATNLVEAIRQVMDGYDFEILAAPDRKEIFNPLAVPLVMQDWLEGRANIRGCDRVEGREAERLSLFCNHQVLQHALKQTGVDLVVAGPSLLPDLKMLAKYSGQIVPTILTDYLHGVDYYAKMSAKRANQINWPIEKEDYANQLPQHMIDLHFHPDRIKYSLLQSKFSALIAHESA
ncbi:MAG: prephenate dehydratase domain-containing protein [Chloroflexota bacterium]